MPKRSSNSRDLKAMASAFVSDATSDVPARAPYEGKDPLAVELGRRGGRKGGTARAARMTADERSEAARRAARKRWDG